MWFTVIAIVIVVTAITGYVMRRDRNRRWSEGDINTADNRRRAQGDPYMNP